MGSTTREPSTRIHPNIINIYIILSVSIFVIVTLLFLSIPKNRSWKTWQQLLDIQIKNKHLYIFLAVGILTGISDHIIFLFETYPEKYETKDHFSEAIYSTFIGIYELIIMFFLSSFISFKMQINGKQDRPISLFMEICSLIIGRILGSSLVIFIYRIALKD